MTGATILGLSGPILTAEERAFFRAANPWGFILFARNIETPAQVSRLTAALRDCVGREAPILIDQEGGRVQRLRAPHWRDWLPALDQAAVARDPARSFWLRGRIMAQELLSVGIDANCAPCCDIATPDTHPFLRNRCMGSDADTVTRNARAMAEGLLAGGVLPIVKHIPGHGRAVSDSHLVTPEVAAPAEELDRSDFEVFRRLNCLPMAMTSHVRYTAFDDRPATQSVRMVGVIRDEIGFDGLLMSDDIGMEALSGTPGERARASIAAGCDVVLHCNGTLAEMQDCVAAAGEMIPAARFRAQTALAARVRPAPVDISLFDTEFEGLMCNGGAHV